MSFPTIQRMAGMIVCALMAAAPLAAIADDVPEVTLTLQDHKFSPASVTIPANTKVKLILVNKDPVAEEFESHDLGREKIVAGNASISVFVGPLKAGHYGYFGDFHPDTAQGVLIAR